MSRFRFEIDNEKDELVRIEYAEGETLQEAEDTLVLKPGETAWPMPSKYS